MKKKKRMMNSNIPNNNPNNNGKIDDAVKFWMNARKQLDNPYSPEPTGKNITPNQENTDEDMVNNPSHYQSLESNLNIDCITAMQAAFGKYETAVFCKLNAFKYLWRATSKGGNQDIDKALWYLEKYRMLGGEDQ